MRLRRLQRPVRYQALAPRKLRWIALLLASLALLISLHNAAAIITPDEPTPPRSPQPKASPLPENNGASTAKQADDAAAIGAAAVPASSSEALAALVDNALLQNPAANAAATGSGNLAVDTAVPSTDRATTTKAQADKSVASPSAPAAPVVEIVQERHVRGRGAGEYIDDDDLDDRDLFAHSSMEIEDSDSDGGGGAGSGKRQNYASLDAGATILDSSPELKSPTNLLVPDKDRYMLMPCEKPRKWVVVSLSEDVHADAIAVANYEKFSSTVKEFIVLGSVNYPTDTWFVLGNFTAAQQNGEQIFPLDAQHHVRYIKLRFFSHYGSEYYCTLSQLKVYGRTFTQVISQLEKSIDAETALDVVLLPEQSDLVTRPNEATEPARELAQCSVPTGPTWMDIVVSETAVPDSTCSVNDAPKQTLIKPAPFLVPPDRVDDHGVGLTSRELVELEALGRHVDVSPAGAPANASATATTAAAKSNASTASAGSAQSMPQGLGRLESIFVRITKKIQQLELNQSAFARQLEDTQSQQKALTLSLHAKHDALAAQIQEIRTLLTAMSTRMELEAGLNSQYRRLVEDLRKDNAALWNEMLMVREVITTMKAGILCALILSACIIVFYLLRLLFRCIQSAKKRADLREWFWRVETLQQERHEDEAAAAIPRDDSDPVGAWRLNYKHSFGSSWDDLAIERKTLLRELVGDTTSSLHTLDGSQRNRRARTASLTPNPPKLQELITRMRRAYDESDDDHVTIKKEEPQDD